MITERNGRLQCSNCGTRVSSYFNTCPNCATIDAINNAAHATHEAARIQANATHEQTVQILAKMTEIENARKIEARLNVELLIPSETAYDQGQCCASVNLNHDITLHEDGRFHWKINYENPYISDRLKNEFNQGYESMLCVEIFNEFEDKGSPSSYMLNLAYQWGKEGLGVHPAHCSHSFTSKVNPALTISTESYPPFMRITLTEDGEKWNLFYKELPFKNPLFAEKYLEGLKFTLSSNDSASKNTKNTFINNSNEYFAKEAKKKTISDRQDRVLITLPILLPIACFIIFNSILKVSFFTNHPYISYIVSTLASLIPTFIICSIMDLQMKKIG